MLRLLILGLNVGCGVDAYTALAPVDVAGLPTLLPAAPIVERFVFEAKPPTGAVIREVAEG